MEQKTEKDERKSKRIPKKLLGETVSHILAEIYPDAECALNYKGDPWKLLVMARLSAQCTDARVNLVCEALFEKLPTMEAMANADISVIEELIRSCGLYHMKAKDLKEMSRQLIDEHSGQVPSDMDDLLSLSGVGRKIANLIRGDLYHLPAIVADTHCIRICGRLGFYPESLKDPVKVERELVKVIKPSEQSDFCHRIVLFGRETCSSRAPKCDGCPLNKICKKYAKEHKI
ncbi:MAG: endonuclease III [Clostridia bacterium]|nr:endonuclease III [Clostridia bacterium]